MPLVDSIATCDFLCDIPESLLRRFEELAHLCHYAPGAVMYIEGLEHPELHIVAEGHVHLDMQIGSQGRIPIMTCGPGDMLDCSALLGDSHMTATAVALDAVKTIAFRGQQLQKLCATEYEIGYYVMRQLSITLSRRLVAARLHLLEMSTYQIPTANSLQFFDSPANVRY